MLHPKHTTGPYNVVVASRPQGAWKWGRRGEVRVHAASHPYWRRHAVYMSRDIDRRNSGPRSAYGAALAEARSLAAQLNERWMLSTPHNGF